MHLRDESYLYRLRLGLLRMFGRKCALLLLGDEQVKRPTEFHPSTPKCTCNCAVFCALLVQLFPIIPSVVSSEINPPWVATTSSGLAIHSGGSRGRGRTKDHDSEFCGRFQNNSVIFSPHGRLLVWGAGPVLHIWDNGSERQLHRMRIADYGCITSLAFLASGRFLALSLNAPPRPPTNLLWMIEPNRGRPLSGTLPSSGLWWWWVMCGSLDGKWLAYDTNDVLPLHIQRLSLRETTSGTTKNLRWRQKLLTTALAFSPDDRLLAVARMDGRVHLLSVPSLEDQRDLKIRNSVATCVAFSRDGMLAAAGRKDGRISLWEVGTGVELPTLNAHKGPVASLSFAPFGSTIASGGKDGIIRFWNPRTGNLMMALTGQGGWVKSIAFSPDGKTLASAGRDGTVRLWDVATGKQQLVLDGGTGKPEPSSHEESK
jgi:WD40 repeat protein